jgi:hypothetical protein
VSEDNMPLIQFIHLCMMNPFNRRELFLRINNSDVPDGGTPSFLRFTACQP